MTQRIHFIGGPLDGRVVPVSLRNGPDQLGTIVRTIDKIEYGYMMPPAQKTKKNAKAFYHWSKAPHQDYVPNPAFAY